MVIFKNERDIIRYLNTKKVDKAVIGFVPTMGALHAGHRSLVEKAREDCDIVVCSIFINPTQFNDKSDFEKYPVSEAEDISMLMEAGCDVLFLPAVAEIYPKGTESRLSVNFGELDAVLEGAFRPGHFRGVAQVVSRLLDIIGPDKLYLGQKDFQQCMVIRKLLEQENRTAPIQLVICPTLREPDGLAMSSRNLRLTEPQRALAGILYQCLVSIQSKQGIDPFEKVERECMDLLRDKGFQPDYVALADARDLTLLKEYDEGRPMVALIAAKIGEVRLIDNLLLNPVGEPVLA